MIGTLSYTTETGTVVVPIANSSEAHEIDWAAVSQEKERVRQIHEGHHERKRGSNFTPPKKKKRK